MITLGLLLLMRHEEQFAALRADPGLAPRFVEELLRYEPPVHFAVRAAGSVM